MLTQSLKTIIVPDCDGEGLYPSPQESRKAVLSSRLALATQQNLVSQKQ